MSYQDPSEIKYSSDMSSFLKAIGYLSFLAFLVGVLFLTLGCFRISSYAFRTYESIDKLPENKVGLLLGTSSLDINGNPNDFFTYRIMAATQLYKAGKIHYILVSGDNRHVSYNEPRQMTRALIKAGVPANRIVSDYAGNSTLDSVIRARKVFLLKSVTIISQDFQNERALFIADKSDINAVGFNALSPDYSSFSRVGIREFFARIKCVLDMYVLHTQPMYLGKPEAIGQSALPKELSNKPKHLTSALKHLTDGAKLELLAKKIKMYEPIAKKLTDAASVLNAQENLEPSYTKDVPETEPNEEELALSKQQNEILSEEQKEALQEASEVASESLNAATSETYIDPNAVANTADATDSADTTQSEKQPKTNHRKVIRKDIKKFNGDPWDYY